MLANFINTFFLIFITQFLFCNCTESNNNTNFYQSSMDSQKNQTPLGSLSKIKSTTDTATFGAGCFWCVEAIFQNLNGVQSVQSGYAGGNIKNPSYKEVCNGNTGHAEVCQIIFDPSKITFSELLEVFWKTLFARRFDICRFHFQEQKITNLKKTNKMYMFKKN